jgi:hypothetical protein
MSPTTHSYCAACLGFGALLLLSACNNQYGPPVDGQPINAGQQRYLDNQRYQELLDHSQSD